MRRLLGCATAVTNTLLCAAMGKGVAMKAMKRFTTEGTNDQEGLGLIPAQRNTEEVPPLGLSFEGGEAGARRLSRRQAIGLLGGSLAGVSLLSFGLAAPANTWTPPPGSLSPWAPFNTGDHITLECEGTRPGPSFLDGRTQDGTVGLAPHTTGVFTGTRWEVFRQPGTDTADWGVENRISLHCLGKEPGKRWLDGRTQSSGTVGLAPSNEAQFSGAHWEVYRVEGTAGLISLRCLGHIPGPRWLEGRTRNDTVAMCGSGYGPCSSKGSHWTFTIPPK
jgi:hypothetical protein